MSQGPGIVNAGGAVDLRKALLRASRSNSILQDWIDAADLSAAIGDCRAAEVLRGLVTLRVGFSPAGRRTLRQLGETAEVSREGELVETTSAQGLSIDLAVAELRQLIPLGGRLGLLAADLPLPRVEVSVGAPSEASYSPALRELGRSVAATLRSVPSMARYGELGRVLSAHLTELLKLQPIQPDEHVGLGLEELLDLLALEEFRLFSVTNLEILHGNPALLEAAAKLNQAALGPFFSNTAMVLRTPRDIFALIEVAAGSPLELDELEFWVVLLSSHLPDQLLEPLCAELGDRGMEAALRRILGKVAYRGGVRPSFGVAQAIRDASLDLDAYRLAADAQQLVALWRRAYGAEWTRLGELRGYDADLPAAKQAFELALRCNPEASEAKAMLARIERGEQIAFAERTGRRLLRRARVRLFQAQRRPEKV